MTEQEVFNIILRHLDKQFPKTCQTCQKQYHSLKEYLLNTTRVGVPISYDAFKNDWQPEKPLGTMVLANCQCGSTLALTSKGINLLNYWRILRWIKKEITNRNQSLESILVHIRQSIINQVLTEESKQNILK